MESYFIFQEIISISIKLENYLRARNQECSSGCNETKQNYSYGTFLNYNDTSLTRCTRCFPLDPNEFWDTDGDGVGDNSENDIDGDGTSNSEDEAPFDAR